MLNIIIRINKVLKKVFTFSTYLMKLISFMIVFLAKPSDLACFHLFRLSRSSSSAQLSKPQKLNFQGRKNAPMMDKLGSSTNITKVGSLICGTFYKVFYYEIWLNINLLVCEPVFCNCFFSLVLPL